MSDTPRTIRIAEPEPLGDVTLAPSAVTGCSESDLARSMTESQNEAAAPAPAVAALMHLRALLPQSLLTLRHG